MSEGEGDPRDQRIGGHDLRFTVSGGLTIDGQWVDWRAREVIVVLLGERDARVAERDARAADSITPWRCTVCQREETPREQRAGCDAEGLTVHTWEEPK